MTPGSCHEGHFRPEAMPFAELVNIAEGQEVI